jgi:catecholate siderophore receptor
MQDQPVPIVRVNSRRREVSPQALIASLALGLCAEAGEAWSQEKRGVGLPTMRVEGQVPTGYSGQDDYKVDHVQSPKQTAPLTELPQTVTVIPQAVIREQGARDLTEALRNTPGISFNAGENGFSTSTNNFSLRGFDTSGNVFIDNMRDSGSYTRDVFNIEQVEVFKGPAADNGRGAPGGYINMVTKTPQLQDFAAGEFSFGFDKYHSESRKRVTLDANQRVFNNAAFRMNVMYENSGVAGRDVAERDTWGIAPSIAFGLGTDTRFTLAYDHVKHDDLPDWGVPGAMVNGDMKLQGSDRYDPTTRGASRDSFYGLKSDKDDTERDSVLARFEHDFSDNMTLSSQTRWTHIDRFSRFTAPTGYVTATREVTTSTQFYDRRNTTIGNLTNLTSRFRTGQFAHTLATGVELTREVSKGNRRGNVNPGNTDVFDPDPRRAGAIRPDPTETNKTTIHTAAAYAYDTIALHPQWELTGGVRGEWYKVEIRSRDLTGPDSDMDGYDKSKFTLGGKIGLVHKVRPNGNIYAAFGAAALPPGSYLSNSDISRTGDNAFPGFVAGARSVMSFNYEIGTKWNLMDGRLATTAALFRSEKQNVPIFARGPGDPAATLNGYGTQIVQGVELSAAGTITSNWNVFAGLAWTDSKRKHGKWQDRYLKATNATDYGNHDRTSGDELAFTPHLTANLWTTYRLPFGLTVGGGVRHTGSSYLGRPDDANRVIPNGTFGKLESYTTFHGLLSYEVVEGVDVRFNADNIFNKDYVASSNWNSSRVFLGAPRTFMLSAGFRF